MAELLGDIEQVKRLVVEAGQRALNRRHNEKTEYKADHTVVTAADRDTEEFLFAELSRAYPGYAFLGEEYGWRGATDVPLWACDPIDGTTNYVLGMPPWCVSVGLLHEGIPQLGAVYLPVTDELFWGIPGQGSFCNGIPLQAEDRDSLHVEDTLCLTSNSLKTLNTDVIAGRIRAFGSIATELCYTARGNLCGTIGLHEGIVDMAAALCICFEAGCGLHHLSGPPVDIRALIETRRTESHFVVAPPRLTRFLQGSLRGR